MISVTERAFAEEQKLYNAKGKRDPFVQLVTSGTKVSAGGLLSVESLEEVTVEGIVVGADPKDSIAVNGIEGYKPLYQEETKKA